MIKKCNLIDCRYATEIEIIMSNCNLYSYNLYAIEPKGECPQAAGSITNQPKIAVQLNRYTGKCSGAKILL
jgi:hypothetical protein